MIEQTIIAICGIATVWLSQDRRHGARHTFCSLRVQKGFSYAFIGKLVGDRATMIEEVYGHLAPHHLMAASNMDTSALRSMP